MKLLALVLPLALSHSVLAQNKNPTGFKSLNRETQDAILSNARPQLKLTCLSEEPTALFDGYLETLRNGKPCLRRIAGDSDLVTYLREEATDRCVAKIVSNIKKSTGSMVDARVGEEDYLKILKDVADRIESVGCRNER